MFQPFGCSKYNCQLFHLPPVQQVNISSDRQNQVTGGNKELWSGRNPLWDNMKQSGGVVGKGHTWGTSAHQDSDGIISHDSDLLIQKNSEIKKLKEESIKVMKENKTLKNKISMQEVTLKDKESELVHAQIEINKFKIEKDFKSQLDEAWKVSYCKEIDKLKAELELKDCNQGKNLQISSDKKIECDKCSLSFKTAGLLRRHIRLEHSSDYILSNIKKEVVEC